MKKILGATLISFIAITSVFAQNGEGPNKEQMLAKAKERMLGNADKHIGLTNEFKSCVNGANSKEELKACGHKMKQSMKALREENKEMRNEMKEKRQEMKEEKRNERMNKERE